MDARVVVAAAGAFAALAVTLVAFGDLPLLGTLFGAAASGAIAGLLAASARSGARAGFAAGALAVALLLAFALSRAEPLPARPVGQDPVGVVVAQMLVVGFVPPLVGAVLGRLLGAPAGSEVLGSVPPGKAAPPRSRL